MTDKIDVFFNIEEDKQELSVINPIIHSTDIQANTLDDYSSTRESMKTMITRGTEMLDDLIKVTKESESPRAYEVLSGYMKNLTEMNKSLIELHKNVKEVTGIKNEQTTQETTNYVYVGSTEQLQQQLDNE